jgi:ribosomal protein S18 acetylase RimI-like enzyme
MAADATHLACFVDMASEGLAETIWDTVRQPGQTLFEVGRGRALREEGSFSYRNGSIAEIDGVVAGGLVSYRIAEDHNPHHRTADARPGVQPPAFVTALLELEAMISGYWYVNVIATYPEYRGRGAGAVLLAHADDLGRKAGAKGMGLIVDADNCQALSVYERVGYREFARPRSCRFPCGRTAATGC